MTRTTKANRILWAANVVLILGIARFALTTFILPDSPVRAIDAPSSLPIDLSETEPPSPSTLMGLPNPLEELRRQPPSDLVCLIGTVRIANDPTADTAYLLIVGRKVHVNAYVGEPVRDESVGREVPELTGWRLKRVTPSTAIFSTPAGERILPIQQIAASVKRETADSAGALLDDAAWLFKLGLMSEAASRIELALEFRPESGTIYSFMMRVGEDLMASWMNSRDQRIRDLGYRLFELAKAGGDRRRTRSI